MTHYRSNIVIGLLTISLIITVVSLSKQEDSTEPTDEVRKALEISLNERPPQPPSGLDPVQEMLFREREKTLELEERFKRVERVLAYQIQQIKQLQRIAFGSKGIGDPPVLDPISTPPELESAIGSIGDAPQ